MTSNHILLYRIAELMFEHEKHVMPVDVLFDDEQIGDFVKSIQIDSPYQQMLFEGVLTESIKEEKLYVSFTVEGYFHYVLGEVIYNRTVGLNAEALKEIVEENKLNGAKEGVEQCLIRDVQKDDLTRLMWLIDRINFNEIELSILLVPIKTAINIWGVEYSLNKLFHEQSENDWKILNSFFTEDLFNSNVLSEISLFISKFDSFNTNTSQKVFGKAILSITNKNLQFDLIDRFRKYIKYNNGILATYDDLDKNSTLVSFYEKNRQFELWLNCINDCINYELQHYAKSHYFLANSYNLKGLVLLTNFYKKYDEAIEYFYKAYEIRKINYHEDVFEISTIEHNLGLAFLYKSELDQAIFFIESSLKKRRGINGLYSIQYALTLALYAQVLNGQGDYLNAEISLINSLDIIKRINPTDYWTIGNSLNNLGQILYEREKYDDSVLVLKESLTNLGKAFLENHFDLSKVYYNLGKSYHAKGYNDEALSCYLNSMEIATNVFESNIPSEISNLYISISDIYFTKGDFKNALEYQQKVLDIELKILGEEHPDMAFTYSAMGIIYFNLKDFHRALDFYQKCLFINLNSLDINYSILASLYNSIGLVYDSIAEYEKGIEFYRKSLDIIINFSDFNQNEVSSQYFKIGNCLQKLEKYEEAISNYKNGFNIERAGGFPYKIAECYLELDNKSEALTNFVQSAEIRKENMGIEDENTQAAIQKSKEIALEINQYDQLPEWIKNI